jgi:hypothetical protein
MKIAQIAGLTPESSLVSCGRPSRTRMNVAFRLDVKGRLSVSNMEICSVPVWQLKIWNTYHIT